MRDKAEFARLLERWFAESSASTIGDATPYGGTPCVRLELGERIAVLNADTTRDAVREYLADVARRGANASWTVAANRRGRINKLNLSERGEVRGWYCYLVKPADAEVSL